MPYRYDIFIGSDNDSKKISKKYLDKLSNLASELFPDGYTLLRGYGYFDGSKEDSVIISVVCDEMDIRKLYRLKSKLKQSSILVVRSPIDADFI
jgi:uncharacterized membrane-anchored protein YitT (DUF2179 family)